MLTVLNAKRLGQRAALVALLCGVGIAANSITTVSAQPERAFIETIVFDRTQPFTAEEAKVRKAVESFIRGMKQADHATVWNFASEEDQAAFGTEAAVYGAFAEVFPAFTGVEEVRFESFSQEGDTPFVQLTLQDATGALHQVDLGLWLDDAGDWKLVSCDVNPVTDQIASL